jgi:hypothetical protein
MKQLAFVVLVAGCSKTAVDDCQRVLDRAWPTMQAEKHGKLTDVDETRLLADCRKNPELLKADPVLKCMLAATDDRAVTACVDELHASEKLEHANLAVKKYAYEAYPMWSSLHPEKACPQKIDELYEFMNPDELKDPWGHPYRMFCGATLPPGAKGLAASSAGPDGKDGTSDDLQSWK